MWWLILGGVTGAVALSWAIAAALRGDRRTQAIIDTHRLDTTAGYTAANVGLRQLIGLHGVTATDLRPYGTVTVLTEAGEVRADARAQDEYLVRGTAVRVTGMEDNNLIVTRLSTLGSST